MIISKAIIHKKFKYHLNKLIKEDNCILLENEVKQFIKTIENDIFESEDENSNKDNNSINSNNIQIIKINSE